jgi:hypothetical protein
MGNHDKWKVSRLADEGEIIDRVIWKLLVRSTRHRMCDWHESERVAIRRRASDLRSGERGGGARSRLDHNLAAKTPCETFGDDSGCDVNTTAGRQTMQERDVAFRPGGDRAVGPQSDE